MINCIPRTDWARLTAATVLAATGALLTATVIGAVVGIPLTLAAFAFYVEPKTLRGTPCAH